MHSQTIFLKSFNMGKSPLMGMAVTALAYIGLYLCTDDNAFTVKKKELLIIFIIIELLLLLRFLSKKIQGEKLFSMCHLAMTVIVSMFVVSLLIWNFSFYSVYQNSLYFKISKKSGGFFADSGYDALGDWEMMEGQLQVLLTSVLEDNTLYYSSKDAEGINNLYRYLFDTDKVSSCWIVPKHKYEITESFDCTENIFKAITGDPEHIAYFSNKESGIASWIYLNQIGAHENVLAVVYEKNVIFIDALEYSRIFETETGVQSPIIAQINFVGGPE